jgi:predicted Rossmann fold nucleotide-binding protein DprA/Smf involved in DNA uptake
MTNNLDVSGIPDAIKARISQIEEQLKQHANLSDELARLRRALAHLEDGIRSRVTRNHRGRRPAAQRKRTTASETASAPRATARAPRGQNKAKIMQSLNSGPKTASQVAKQTGISTGTASATLTKMAKAGEIVKADRGYALPE